MTDQPASTPEPANDTTTPVTPPTPIAPTVQVRKSKSHVINPYIWGTGRRKSSVARVRIKEGNGQFTINKRAADEFFCLDIYRALIRKPLQVTETTKDFDIFVNVKGGGTTGQAGAVLLGLARALIKSNGDHLPALREAGLLTRDAREVERKKYGRRGARRRFQFSKR